MRLVAVFLFLVLVSGTASAQPLAAAPDSSLQLYVISQPLAQSAPPVVMVEDRVIEEYIMLLVFDPTYPGGSLKDAASSARTWKDWEDYYFNREEYRAKLETFLRQYWSVGPWWWQSESKVEVIDELDRGGPIHFRVDYPLIDFRNDLDYQITKDASGQTKVEFTLKQMVVDQKVVGSERHPSRIPADDIDVRPIRNLSEIGAVLPSTQAMDDDIFFGALAARSLPVIEHIQTVNVTEDVMGESRNILVILHDVSTSMNGKKIRWAIRLCELLLDRCIDQAAECILIPYRDYLQGKHVATNEAECQWLKRELSNILQPGGGTETNSALLEVLSFLKTEKFGQVRILLVTDGEDSIDVSGIRQGFDEIGAYLHTVCIAPVSNEDLRSASDRYDYLPFS